jgi:hypothetical protein
MNSRIPYVGPVGNVMATTSPDEQQWVAIVTERPILTANPGE